MFQWKATYQRLFGQYKLVLTIKKKDTKLGEEGREVDLRRVAEASEMAFQAKECAARLMT